ncbi:MAG: sortase [Chloroflexota bacterium]
MRGNIRPTVNRWVGLLFGLVLLLGGSACSDLIIITPLSTPVPTPPQSSSSSTPARPSPAPGGVPTRLVIEAIKLDTPIVEMGWQTMEENGQAVSVWQVPENEAGWHLNSARPGDGSNVVISGHNGSTGGHIFGDLSEVEVGDQITLWTDRAAPFQYQISETQIVPAFNASESNLEYLRTVIQPTQAEQLTLITCWPAWTNTHRFIVIAHPLG